MLSVFIKTNNKIINESLCRVKNYKCKYKEESKYYFKTNI